MDFSLLKSFIAVADEKSISLAAQHLFISQQSLSKQIAKLEEELGTQLFVRSRPLGLTRDGIQFLRVAKQILHLKQQYEETTNRTSAGSQYIHMGIEHTVARAALPYVLPVYLQEHPDTYVKMNEASPEVLQKAVTHDGVDLVIGSIVSTPESYETVELCKKEQMLVVPVNIMEALAGKDRDKKAEAFSRCADLRYFEKAPFIKIPPQSSGGRTLASYMKYYDISPNFVCELTNMENAFQLANSGLGVLIYPRLFWDLAGSELQKDYLKNIYVFPLPYLPDIDRVCAYFHKERVLHGGTLELLKTFKDFFADYDRGELGRWLSKKTGETYSKDQ